MQQVEEGLSYYMKKLLEQCNFHTDFFHYLFFVAGLKGKKKNTGGHLEKTGVFLQFYYLWFPISAWNCWQRCTAEQPDLLPGN